MAMRKTTYGYPPEPAIYEYSKARADLIYEWCVNTFGYPGPDKRWWTSGGWIFFKNSKDYNWCVLTWQ